MTKTAPGRIRGILYFFLALSLFIVVTGGGKIGKVDFVSADVWVAFALLFAWTLHRRNEPILGPKLAHFSERVGQHPYLILGLVFGILGITHFTRFLTLGVNLFDAGFLYQAMFHGFATPFLKCDVCHLGTYLGAHTAFTLPLLTPIVNVFGTPFVIPLVQAAIGFLTFLVIGRAFRRELTARDLTFIFLALLAVRGIRKGFLFDFREDLLAAAFFTIGLCLVKAKRYTLALVPFILGAFSKETGAILLPFVAVVVVLIEREDREDRRVNLKLGLTYFGITVPLSLLIIFYILPHWTPNAGAGGDMVSRLRFLTGDGGVGEILSQIATRDRFKYLFHTLVPVSLIAFRQMNPYYLPGIVLVLGNLISGAPSQRMMQFHYELLLIPFFGFGISESIRQLKSADKTPRSFYALTLLAFFALSGTWPLYNFRRHLENSSLTPDVLWSRTQLKEIPQREPILADSETFPVLTDRLELRFFDRRTFDPAGVSAMSPLPIGDSRIALIQRDIGEKFLGPEWTETACGPGRFICRYDRKAPN